MAPNSPKEFLGRLRRPYIVFTFRYSYGFVFVYIYIYHHPPPPHSASCNVRMQYVRQCFYEQGHQRKLLRVTTPSASRVFALVDGRKKPPAQVAEGQGDRAPVLIGMQWGTTMNASTVLVLVEQHKLEQDAATGMQLALGQNTVHI